MGIPSVPVITKAFKNLVVLNAAKRGMPHERITFTPHPVWGKTPDELRAYVNGPDPVSGKPMMKEIVASLTTPLTDDEKKTGMVSVSIGPPTFTDTLDNLQEFYMNNGYTDFMPIIVPTEEKVETMLKATSHHPDEMVGKMAAGAYPPWSYNVRQVAASAVMAGARPEYFPIILAIASSGIASLFSSTNSFAFAMVINGPIRDKLEFNYGIGALGPFAQANATIGRAWTILSKNLGNGGIPGDTYLGSLGNNLNYNNVVIAEDEANSPWPPFHVQRGFKPEENVVSIFRGLGVVPGQVARGSSVNQNPEFDHQLSDLFSTFTGFFGALIIADPLVARRLKEQGYDTKEQLIQWLYKNTTQTVKDYKSRNYAYLFDYPRALQGVEPYATWYKLPDDTVIPHFPRASDFNIVVAGGQTNAYPQAGNLSYGVSVSIDKWM
ncbi:MAG TPA: UGSC family (seleno)protein [Candidatus Acidoferrales bacterium]|nr:UGSC family (seleno)protein [Candidatus Acidoferrales bacterium]